MGNFENNKKMVGTEKYPDCPNYEGNFINNKKNGDFIYTFPYKEYFEEISRMFHPKLNYCIWKYLFLLLDKLQRSINFIIYGKLH